MIIQCESCSRKFIVRDQDIPKEGRVVQCGYCSSTWHQLPAIKPVEKVSPKKTIKPVKKINESLSVDAIKASDGKTYKFLGSQWAELLPSGKTGLFAKKKIGKELDKITGRKRETPIDKKKKKVKKEVDPLSESLTNEKNLPEVYKPKHGLGFFGYIFLVIIIGFSLIGILKTFENDLLINFPEMQNIYEILDLQLEYFSETIKNMVIIVQDLLGSY